MEIVELAGRKISPGYAPFLIAEAGVNHDGDMDMAMQRAVAPAMRQSLLGMQNPYGDGHAAERIVFRLRDVPRDEKLIMKRFYDLPHAEGST